MEMVYVLLLLTQTEWTKYSGNPVMTREGNFYENAIGSPSVIFLRDTFRMYYAAGGQDGRGRISYAYSTDGINWVKYDSATPVLEPDTSSWDSHFLDTPEIIYDGQYRLYYFGDSDNDPPGGAIGVAVSSDGINWSRPVLSPVVAPGGPGDWDGLFLESPTVVYDSSSGNYFMYFSGVDTTWRVRIGGAVSPDGISWSKLPSNPLITPGGPSDWDGFAVATPTVIKRDTLFEMWYCGASVSDIAADGDVDTIWIGYATSTDGINWTKHPENPLFGTYTPPFSAFELRGPWAPDVVFLPDRNGFMMWYETAFGFGLATSPLTTVREDGGRLPATDTIGYYLPDGRRIPRPIRGMYFAVVKTGGRKRVVKVIGR